jgi:hypothetical protein
VNWNSGMKDRPVAAGDSEDHRSAFSPLEPCGIMPAPDRSARARRCRSIAIYGHSRTAARRQSGQPVRDGRGPDRAGGDARVGAAVVQGLLTRTYFRDGADAANRTGIAGTGMLELAKQLDAQARELARRGRPVDGEVADPFR